VCACVGLSSVWPVTQAVGGAVQSVYRRSVVRRCERSTASGRLEQLSTDDVSKGKREMKMPTATLRSTSSVERPDSSFVFALPCYERFSAHFAYDTQ
jgi:hypothetical protein